jgi:hypothetical protein
LAGAPPPLWPPPKSPLGALTGAPLSRHVGWQASVLWRAVGPNTSRRLLKHKRKAEAKELRALVKFAEQYDPMRKTQATFLETLKKLGWAFRRNETITEGVTVLAAMTDKYLAFEVGGRGGGRHRWGLLQRRAPDPVSAVHAWPRWRTHCSGLYLSVPVRKRKECGCGGGGGWCGH